MVSATTGPLPLGRDERLEQGRLVSAAAAQDQKAFAELYGRYSRKVYNLILRSVRNPQTAEDVAQEVWVKVYRDLNRLRDPLAFPAWLYQLTSKTCVDAARKRTRAPQTAAIPGDMAAASDGPEEAALGGLDAQLTREALAALPANQHLALFLREVEARSYREISEVLGISETAVGLCLMRARRSFAKAYHRLDGASQQERCELMQPGLARVFDGEASPLQRAAVDGHLASCSRCREDVQLMREGSKRYATLALAPVPAAVSGKIFAALGLGVVGGLGGAAGLIGSLAGKVKMVLLALLAGAGVTAGVAVVPGARPALLDAVSHLRPAPVVSSLAGGGSTAGTTASTDAHRAVDTTSSMTSSIGLARPTGVSTPVPVAGQSLLPAPAAMSPLTSLAGRVTASLGAVAPVAPITIQNPLPVASTIATLPSLVSTAVPLQALPTALPTVTVAGVNLP